MTLRKPINGNQRKPLDMIQSWHVILWKLVLFGVDTGVILITYNDHVCGNLLNTLRKYHTEPQAHGFYPACVAGTLPKPSPKDIMTMSPEPPPEPTTLLSFSLPYWNGPPIFISLSFHGPQTKDISNISYNDHVCGTSCWTRSENITQNLSPMGFILHVRPEPFLNQHPKVLWQTMSPEPPPEPTTLLSFSLPYRNGPLFSFHFLFMIRKHP